MSIKGFSVNGVVQRYDYTALDNLPQGQGVSDDLKAALLQLAQKVAYIDDQGQTYYDDLYDALYPEKTLLSITANFQQGQAVVYNTDSLDSLKQYLTVTATYDDASTETVPSSAYTLSGTLTTGTSVITVTYDGKTDAFNVTVTAAPMALTVTNNLTGCTTSNSATSVLQNSSYTAVITASSGYTLVGATVSITMGGQDITTSAYSGGIITINNVTGALVISVAAVAVVLNSISAVYTQSGTVYTTDTLDSLKADLVVTAHYSDSSTQTVAAADYTLSGTLTAGTSTVTVAYHGKTTTFTVAVTHRVVPSGYTAYDYVKYTGTSYSDSATPMAFVLTTKQFTDVNSLILDFDVMPAVAQTGGAAGILGCQSDSGNENTVAFYGRTDTQRISAFTKGAAVGIDNIPNMQVNKKVHVRLNPGTQSPSTLSADSLTQTVAWSTYNALNAKIGYFGNARISYSKITIKPFAALGTLRIYDLSENLIGEYVPCVRDSDSVIGVYDNVENVFHTASTAAYATVGNENCVYAVGSWEA